MAWRQRLYSFLLRRIVGPYLAPSCSAKLHECLEVSLQEGRFVLKDLDLDASYLTEALQPNKRNAPVIIQKARIEKLVINLSMQETGIHPDSEQVSRYKDSEKGTGGTDALKASGPRVSLVAQVEIEGVDIELVPRARRSPCPNSEQSERFDAQNRGEVQYPTHSLRKKEESSGGCGGIISLYVDAALRSLRLGLQISDVFVKIFNRDATTWIGIRLQQASYHDVLDPPRSLSDPGALSEATRHQKKSVPATVLHKALDFVGVQILTGEGMPDKSNDDVCDSKADESHTTIVAQTEGTGQIRFLVVSYDPGTLASTPYKGSMDSNLSADKASNTAFSEKKHRQIQRDVEVFLEQRFSVCVDCVALERIETVLSGISDCWHVEEMGEESSERETTKGSEEALSVPALCAETVKPGRELIRDTQTHSDFDSKNDVTILSGMMLEYAEARSLASTREVRGGMLVRSCSFDDSSKEGDHEGTFDAFFDANDQSFHHYRSILSESAQLDEHETDADAAFIRTKVKFHLLEGSMKLIFPSVDRCSPLAGLEYVLVTFGDLDATASISRASSDLTLIVAHFEVEDSVSDQLPSSTTVVIGSLLRFVQTDEGQCEMDSSFIVSPAPCLSLHISLTQECLVEATLLPLDLTYRHSTFSRISGMLGSFVKNDRDVKKTDTQAGGDSVDEELQRSLLVKATCNALSISIPMDTDNSKIPLGDSRRRDFDALFERCGYNLSSSVITTKAAVGFTMQEVSIVIGTGNLGLGEPEESKSGGQTTTVSCEHAILFATSPITDDIGVCHGTKRSDLMAWSGITDVEPNSLIIFSQRSFASLDGFPIVPPLSSVKARQEYESGDIGLSKSARTSTFAASAGSNPSVRGSDPQKAMSAEVNDACSFIDVHIPYVDCDWTAEEWVSMVGAITGIIANIAGLDDTRNQPSSSPAGHPKNNRIAVGISCDQLSACVHDSFATDNAASQYSYMLVADGYKSHLLIGSEGFRNIRVLSHDLTLFEINSPSSQKNPRACNELDSVVKRCKEVRSRCCKNSTSRSKPLLHRSKLSRPLSPDTPALLLDILIRASTVDGDGDYKENTIYFSLYDMTHRYDVESEWFSRFLRVFQGRPKESLSVGTNKDGTQDVLEELNDDSSSMTSIFISLADCTLDYTSPARCQTASRTMISVSELRMSSNIVAPSGDANVQAYKVAVSDVCVKLCNHRFPYNSENSRLTRAKALISAEDRDVDQRVDGAAGSYTNAINEMEFITVATLDSLDALLSHAKNSSQSGSHQHKPNLTATLDFGRLSLYTCRDSFACLVNTFGEWQLKFTALSDQEIDALKAAAAAASENDTSASSARSKHCQLVVPSRPSQTVPRGKTVKATSLLDDAIENDIFMKTGDSLVGESVNGTNGSRERPNAYADVPDCELSASELREKHGMIQKDDVSTDLAKSLLIKNFYTIDTSPTQNGLGRSFVDEKRERHRTSGESHQSNLGGHDWTTVDHKWSLNTKIPLGEDQNAEWYESSGDEGMYCADQGVGYRAGAQERKKRRRRRRRIHVFPQHIAVNPVPDPLSEGDMDAAKFAGTTVAPPVGLRVIIKDLSVNCRFFDGYDWATSRMPAATTGNPKTPFIVRENTEALELKKKQMQNNVVARLTKKETPKHIRDLRRKAKIMGELLDDEVVGDEGQEKRIECHRIARQTDTFFQMSIGGLNLRFDSFTEKPEHSLASCLDLSVADLFFAETVSKSKPLKMFGEWLNEVEHPRDTNDGMLMMKMVSMHPSTKISADGKLMSDESRVTLEILPLRCFLDQRACRFIRAFFAGDEKKIGEESSAAPTEQLDELEVTATFFQVFKVKPCKLKVNYMPERMDVEALRDGSYVELINLSPIDDMILTLQAVEIRNITGWGAAFGELVGRWVEDICATQIHKFITNSSPFQPLSSLGGSFVDLVVLPWEEIRGDGSVVEGLRSGTKSFAGAVAFETLNTTSKITGFVAKKLDSSVPKSAGDIRSTLPSRPDHTPLNIGDAADHALESVSSGLKKANYKVVIIPYREYRRSGPAGAVKSVVRGIPVAVMAPLSGATEAISYTLLGARNCIRPDIWKEEEASLLGRGADFL